MSVPHDVQVPPATATPILTAHRSMLFSASHDDIQTCNRYNRSHIQRCICLNGAIGGHTAVVMRSPGPHVPSPCVPDSVPSHRRPRPSPPCALAQRRYQTSTSNTRCNAMPELGSQRLIAVSTGAPFHRTGSTGCRRPRMVKHRGPPERTNARARACRFSAPFSGRWDVSLHWHAHSHGRQPPRAHTLSRAIAKGHR